MFFKLLALLVIRLLSQSAFQSFGLLIIRRIPKAELQKAEFEKAEFEKAELRKGRITERPNSKRSNDFMAD